MQRVRGRAMAARRTASARQPRITPHAPAMHSFTVSELIFDMVAAVSLLFLLGLLVLVLEWDAEHSSACQQGARSLRMPWKRNEPARRCELEPKPRQPP